MAEIRLQTMDQTQWRLNETKFLERHKGPPMPLLNRVQGAVDMWMTIPAISWNYLGWDQEVEVVCRSVVAFWEEGDG